MDALQNLFTVYGQKTRVYGRGEAVYRAGDEATEVFQVRRGLVGLVAHSKDGMTHLLRLFRPGEYFGHRAALAGERYHATATALEETELLSVPTADVERALADPKAARLMIARLAKDLGFAERYRVDVLDSEVLAKTAHALLYLKGIAPEHRWTRAEIASFCGATVSTIIRTMAKLESAGLIRQDGREFELLNRAELMSMSGFADE